MVSVVKISFESDIRRVMLPEPAKFTLRELHSFAAEAFHIGKCPPVFRYRDDEDEWITLTTDIELKEALQLAEILRRPSLRIHVSVLATPWVSMKNVLSPLSLKPTPTLFCANWRCSFCNQVQSSGSICAVCGAYRDESKVSVEGCSPTQENMNCKVSRDPF